MSAMRYRKKPVVIEAVCLDGSLLEDAFAAFLGDQLVEFDEFGVDIPTLEGTMHANLGDWIIKGVKGELYPCKPDIFEATYEPVGHRNTEG